MSVSQCDTAKGLRPRHGEIILISLRLTNIDNVKRFMDQEVENLVSGRRNVKAVMHLCVVKKCMYTSSHKLATHA